MKFSKIALAAVAALGLGTSVQAANWLALQGTEPDNAAERAKLWGFIQPEYQVTDDTPIQAGPWAGQRALFNQQRPDLRSTGGFNILRARFGVRGQGFPLDSGVNYFLLVETGNNGITRGGGGNLKVTDASLTLNYIPGARIRVGQFKYPGAEEGLQAIHVFDYINFTTVTNQMLLERFFDGDGSDPQNPNRPNGPVGAFRDIGVQVFDIFKRGDWEHSYAFMVGNGNGITRGDNDDNKDFYAYWSSERIYAGKGARRQELKLFAWLQSGKRTLTAAGAGEYDRDRWGLGATYRKGKWRGAFEYMAGDGMIFAGSDGAAVPGSLNNAGTAVASFNMLPTAKADGWYAHVGYMATKKLELDARYDTYNRATNIAAAERKFDTFTLGAQYFFNKKARFLLNYEFRDAEAPNAPATAGPNKILGGMDDRLSAQFLIIF